MTPATLRRARVTDAAALVQLEVRAFRSYYASHRFSHRQFTSYLSRPTTIGHVVAVEGRLVAYALGVARNGRARLHSIAVDPGVRAGRLGQRLLRAFLAAARRRGCDVASLEVAARNRPAIALFTRQGFVPVRRLPAYYSASTDGVRMQRILPRRHRGRPAVC